MAKLYLHGMKTDWKKLVPEMSKRSGYSEEEIIKHVEDWSNALRDSYSNHEHWVYDFFRLGSIRVRLPYLRSNTRLERPNKNLIQLYRKALESYPEFYAEELKKWHEKYGTPQDKTASTKQD